MHNPQQEKLFLRYAIENSEYLKNLKPSFFVEETYKKILIVLQGFQSKHGNIPSKHQFNELLYSKNLYEKISTDAVETVYSINLNELDSSWLTKAADAFLKYKSCYTGLLNAVEYFKNTEATPENVNDIIQAVNSTISLGTNVNYDFDEGLDFYDSSSHQQLSHNTFSSGYPYVDLVLGGGYESGGLVVFAGPPKIGKSIFLSNFALQSSLNGYNTVFISLEMKDRKIAKRMGSNFLGITMSDYKDISQDVKTINKKMSKVLSGTSFMMQQPGQLQIKEFPTSSISVPEVEAWIRKMQQIKAIEYKVIFIDYLNILKNWRNPNTEDSYSKIKQIAEDLRAMGQRNNWAIVTATQINRSGIDAKFLTQSNISESSGLVMTVDAMFGIQQSADQLIDRQYTLNVIANRDEGYKDTYKLYNIDYDYMRLTEDITTEIRSNAR